MLIKSSRVDEWLLMVQYITLYIMNEGYVMYTVLYDSFKEPLQLIITRASILTASNYHILDPNQQFCLHSIFIFKCIFLLIQIWHLNNTNTVANFYLRAKIFCEVRESLVVMNISWFEPVLVVWLYVTPSCGQGLVLKITRSKPVYPQ